MRLSVLQLCSVSGGNLAEWLDMPLDEFDQWREAAAQLKQAEK
ncbi:hypothetical protein [Tepidicaulis marinus]|nr:hypothetical protein [Tepidicaulis marinus]